MKKYIKYLSVLFAAVFIVTSCDNRADKDWTTQEPSFKLYDTSLGANVLYASMENNPFILTWDDAGSSASYSIVVSAAEDFANKTELGTSNRNSFKTTIGALNLAMLKAGLNPYTQQTVYLRVENGKAISNTISFKVTPYPANIPIINNPTSGSSLVLDGSNPTATATTIKWTDYDYGTTVNYTLEVSKKGTGEFIALATVNNAKELEASNFLINEAASKLDLPVNVASEIDLRITAKTESPGGVITKVSDIVTFKITPYQPAYKDLYLVGGGSAVGWDASKAQLLKNSQNITEIYTYLENNGMFRFLGQKNWSPDNYSLNAPGVNDSYKYFKTWSTNLRSGVTPEQNFENIVFTGDSGMYKITIDQNTKDIKVTSSPIPTLPTELFLVGSINGWNAGAAIPMDQINDGVYEHTMVLPDGAEFKFIGQQAWGDLEWANIHTDGNSGYLGPKGDNNNIKFNGGGTTYKITANVKLGIYTIIPL